MRKIKKITSVFLSALIAFSMTAVAVNSVFAAADSNGYYVPGKNVKSVNRYYFAMPNDWLNEYTNSAGVCWYNGTDSLNSAGMTYPGYKAKAGGYKSNTHSIFYTDCPTDVQEIITFSAATTRLTRNMRLKAVYIHMLTMFIMIHSIIFMITISLSM